MKTQPYEEINLIHFVNSSLVNSVIRNGQIVGMLPNLASAHSNAFSVNIEKESGLNDIYILQRFLKMAKTFAGIKLLGKIIKQNKALNIEKMTVKMHKDEDGQYKFQSITLMNSFDKEVRAARYDGVSYLFGARSDSDDCFHVAYQDIAYDYFDEFINESLEEKFKSKIVIDNQLLALLENSNEYTIESLYDMIQNPSLLEKSDDELSREFMPKLV